MDTDSISDENDHSYLESDENKYNESDHSHLESDESESDEIMDTNPNLEAETCSSEIGHPSLGQNDKTSDVTFIYPKRVIEEFTKRNMPSNKFPLL